jgi:hypothetical protein
MRALNPFAPFWYTPEVDKDNPTPTKFKIKGLNGTEIGYVAPEFILGDEHGNVGAGTSVVGLTGKGLELCLKYGLLDWENFENDAGPVAFSRANFHLVEYAIQAELAMQVVAASYPKREEKKTP